MFYDVKVIEIQISASPINQFEEQPHAFIYILSIVAFML